MPLLLALIGKKHPINRGTPGYSSYGDAKSSRTRPNRFNRLVDLSGAARLPEAEGLELATGPHDRLDDNDDTKLVGGAKHLGEIVVTNQIVQLIQRTSTQEDISDQKAEEVKWGGRQPPQAHMARSNV